MDDSSFDSLESYHAPHANTCNHHHELLYAPTEPDSADPLWHQTLVYLKPNVPPILRTVSSYSLTLFKADFVAALSVAVMLLPQSIAYAALAGLSVPLGVRACGVPLLCYCLLGSSKQLSVGPVALVSLLLSEALEHTLTPFSVSYEAAALMIGACAGVLQVLLGVGRLGVLVAFLSHPVVAGFSFASGLIISASQLRHVLGVSVERQPTFFHTVYAVLAEYADINVPALIIGVTTVVFLLSIKYGKKHFEKKWPIPGPLIVVVVATLISALMDLNGKYGTPIVDENNALERTFPQPTMPFRKVSDVALIVRTAFMVAFVGFMESVSLATKFAAEHQYKIDASQELLALGAADIGAAFFGGMPVTGSMGRSALSNSSGAVTQVSGLIAGVLCLSVGGALVPFLAPLPKAALAGIIIKAAISLVSVHDLRHLFKADKRDFLVMVSTIVLTLLLGAELGLLIAIGISLLSVIQRSSTADCPELGVVPMRLHTHQHPIFRSLANYPQAKPVASNVVLLRCNNSLFFANVEDFVASVHGALAHGEPDRRIDAVIVDFGTVPNCDSTAADKIRKLFKEFEKKEVRLALCNVKRPVQHRFSRCGLMEKEFGVHDQKKFPTDLQIALEDLVDERIIGDHQLIWLEE